MTAPTQILSHHRNRNVGVAIVVVAFAMLGLAYASVPLYDLFCRVTGYGGTTSISSAAPGVIAGGIERSVQFNAHTNPDLPWRFSPPREAVRLKPGEETIIYYTATNFSSRTTTGTATFNVTPFKAGPYFMKIDCFCFVEQTLKSGESVQMPVVFYLDPEIDHDANTIEVPEITLSYTFFAVENGKG